MNSREVLLSAFIGLGHHSCISVPPEKPRQFWAMEMNSLQTQNPTQLDFQFSFAIVGLYRSLVLWSHNRGGDKW